MQTEVTTEAQRKKFECPSFVIKHFAKYEKMLYEMILQKGMHMTHVSVLLPEWLFHYEADQRTIINVEDIKEMLCRDLLNISIIQAYSLYLKARLRHQKMGDVVTFLCPETTSLDAANRDPIGYKNYVSHGIMKVVQNSSRYVMIPFHQTNHWVLLLFSIATSQLLVLDPLRMYRDLQIDDLFKAAYMKTVLQQFDNLSIVHLECPRQKDSKSCGYYVMRYMLEIVLNIEKLTKDDEVREHFKNSGKTYAVKDLQFVREQMCLFIIKCFKK